MKLVITFEIEDREEGEKIKCMVHDGLYNLSDGNFFGEECQKRGIKSFNEVDYHIRLTSD